ncbi:hypothetical protein [Streptomyces sp. 2131.1]|uniref:hypothetical protein n=1 Tax=Streptomyces sp. 2131.1 TaxID=1855346 RepID=UPI00115F9ED9|nr:hypothetical protein [Streptomyces sp. 2131.1]
MTAPDLNGRLPLRLASPDRPGLLEARGRMWGPDGSGALRRGSAKARADLVAWWSAAEGWNEAAGRLLELGPDGIREELARQAAEGRPGEESEESRTSRESRDASKD